MTVMTTQPPLPLIPTGTTEIGAAAAETPLHQQRCDQRLDRERDERLLVELIAALCLAGVARVRDEAPRCRRPFDRPGAGRSA